MALAKFMNIMDRDFEGLALDCLSKVFFYRPQNFRYNSSQCNNLSHAFVAKLSPYSANNWCILSPTKKICFTKSRSCSTSKLGFGGKKIMERAWKEVYRVVKEAEFYLKWCSGEKWWIKSITLSTTGEAYSIHVHDLAWSVLCLHLNLLYCQGQTDESFTAAAYTIMGDFHAEMCNSIRIHDEYEDKSRLITVFQELLKDCEETSTSEDKSKLGVARYMSRKLQATIRNEPTVKGNLVSPWLQIDPKDLNPKLRIIGEGTFGKVYEGSWLGVKVAVKEICWYGEDIDSSLLEEIAVHAKLQSPFIVQLIGVCLIERCCYLVMELVSFSLHKILRDRREVERTPFPLAVAVDTMLQISRAMEYLHSQRIMHMDLKASNVLIQPSEVPELRAYGYGRVKLCDFGESRLRLYSFRSTEFSRGTCYWRAPEVFQYPQKGFEEDLGILKRYTHKADVYSFAMTCYEILTGKLPFEGVAEKNVYGLIVQGKRPSLPPWCPSVLADYIQKCWDTDPDCRPKFTHVSYFLRYVKFLLMRVNNSRNWDSLTPVFKNFDVAKFVMFDEEEEQGSDESLIIRALDGDFPDSFQPCPVSQQSVQPLSPKVQIFVSLPDYIQQYSYKEVQNATVDFSRNVSGVSGLMWKGVLSDGTRVTVKKQLLEISMKEINILWQLHHPNAVRLRGFSAGMETFLVYDHMVLGSLAGQLFRPRSILDWNIRKKIGIAIARFLSYLHDNNGKKFLNIHLKCTDILLDERFSPKFCGFLSVNPIDMNSRSLSSSEQQNLHLALQYEKFRNIQDFGIILLELLFGCKWESIQESLQCITNSIEAQGWEYISRLLDEELQGRVDEEEAMKWVKLALSCFARSPLEKLPMNKAVLVMEGLEEFSELPASGSLRDLTPSQILYITSAQQAQLEQDTGMEETRFAWTMANGIQRSIRNTSKPLKSLKLYPEISCEEIKRATAGFSNDNLLGAGNFGLVYKGILNGGREVAVKIFDSTNESAFNYFRAECMALRNVRHRNVVKIIGTCSINTFNCLIFEYMRHGSLKKHLYHPSCELGLKERLNIAIDVSHAMEYLHHHCDEQIVHCDIKPSNVLLNKDLVAHLSDFRIAKLVGENSVDSVDYRDLKGSIGYIAPEYGMSGRVSARGDVYSYGILLLEMLTAKRPTHPMFQGDLTLRKWVENAFPDEIMDVGDQRLGVHVLFDGNSNVLALLRIGLWCSEDSPDARPTITQVSSLLESWRAGTSRPKWSPLT